MSYLEVRVLCDSREKLEDYNDLISKLYIKFKVKKPNIIDLGGNDGSLMSFAKKQGYNVTNIEPTNVAKISKKKGIQTIVNYPTALPFLQCYESYSHRFEDFPVSYMLQENALSLPLYPEMSNEQQEYVLDSIK